MIKRMKWGGVLVASLLMVSSCQNEEIVQNQSAQGQAFTLTASKGVGSRTAIDGNKTVWSEGDKIYVSSKDGKVTGVLTLTDGADDVTGTFSGFVFGNPANLAYSVYPAPTNGTTLDLGSIENGGSLNAPMIGSINQENAVDVAFDHTCGVLCVNLVGFEGQNFTITATNNNTPINLAATADITPSGVVWDGEVPSLKFTSNESSISVTNAKGGVMYIPYYTNATELTNVKFILNGETPLNSAPINLKEKGTIGTVVKNAILTITQDESGEYTPTYEVGSIVEINGVKGIVFSVTDNAVKVVSMVQGGSMLWEESVEWAESLGEGWSLSTLDDLKAIHSVRKELNVLLAAYDSKNVLFEEDEMEDDGSYAAYWSSTIASEGMMPTVHYLYFDNEGTVMSSFAMFPVEYSRAVYTLTK